MCNIGTYNEHLTVAVSMTNVFIAIKKIFGILLFFAFVRGKQWIYIIALSMAAVGRLSDVVYCAQEVHNTLKMYKHTCFCFPYKEGVSVEYDRIAM